MNSLHKTIAAVVFVATAALAMSSWAEPDPTCRSGRGRPGGPIVTNAETARAIFLAVERDFFPGADTVRFPDVIAEDEGDSWSVFRTRLRSELLPNGDRTITIGGGQLSVQISKCDAAISRVYFSR